MRGSQMLDCRIESLAKLHVLFHHGDAREKPKEKKSQKPQKLSIADRAVPWAQTATELRSIVVCRDGGAYRTRDGRGRAVPTRTWSYTTLPASCFSFSA